MYLFQSQMIGLQGVLKCISTKSTAIRRRKRMYPVNFLWGTYMYNANMFYAESGSVIPTI